MTDLKDRIEEAYDKTSAEKIIFGSTNKTVEKVLFATWAAIPFVLLFSFSKGNYFPNWVIALTFTWMIVGLLGIVGYVNFVGKRELAKLEIDPPKGFFSFWANTKYREFRLKKFYKKLKRLDLLNDSPQDIDLLEKYKSYFDGESKSTFKESKFVLGGTLLGFSVPIWNHFLAHLFKENDTQIGNVLLFSVALLTVIFLIVAGAHSFNKMYTDHLNKRSNKFKEIAKLLETLHINLKLRYPRHPVI